MSTVAGLPLLRAQLTEPSEGNWTLDAQVATDEPIDGTVPIDIQGAILLGSVVRGTVDGGVWRGRIEGGNGGMRDELPSRHYVAATVGMVLADIAADSLEALSGEIPPDVTASSLSNWTRAAGSTSRAVADLAAHLELPWRVTRSGGIWVGSERFEPTRLDYTELSRGPAGEVVIAPTDVPAVTPGDLFDGQEVADVVTILTPSRLEQTIWLRQDDAGRMVRVMRSLVDRFAGRRLDYSASYPAVVIAQAGDDTLEVVIDDERMRGDGLRSVPIRLGIPGARCEVNPGARVRVHFDEQDPSKPFAALWDTNAADVSLIEVGSGGELVALAEKTDAEIDRIWGVLTGWTVVASDGGQALQTAADLAVSAVQSVACERLKSK